MRLHLEIHAHNEHMPGKVRDVQELGMSLGAFASSTHRIVLRIPPVAYKVFLQDESILPPEWHCVHLVKVQGLGTWLRLTERPNLLQMDSAKGRREQA